TFPYRNGIFALLRFGIWRRTFHRGLVLDYSRPVFREARVVGRNFPADHASGLDDGYEGADGHAGSRFHERGVTSRGLLLKAEEERPDCLGCHHGGRRGWDTTAIVSRCRSDSWRSAQERLGGCEDMVAFVCAAG